MKLESDAAVHGRPNLGFPSVPQVVARCAISTTTGACFGGTVALLVHLLYTHMTTGKGIWVRCPGDLPPRFMCWQLFSHALQALAGLPAAVCCGGHAPHA